MPVCASQHAGSILDAGTVRTFVIVKYSGYCRTSNITGIIKVASTIQPALYGDPKLCKIVIFDAHCFWSTHKSATTARGQQQQTPHDRERQDMQTQNNRGNVPTHLRATRTPPHPAFAGSLPDPLRVRSLVCLLLCRAAPLRKQQQRDIGSGSVLLCVLRALAPDPRQPYMIFPLVSSALLPVTAAPLCSVLQRTPSPCCALWIAFG